jgi:hypothetical protein
LGASSQRFELVHPPVVYPPLYLLRLQAKLEGLFLTVIALATSMFWFPAPETVDPMVEQFLQAERDYLFGTWNVGKILLTLTIPAFFYFLALAFWKRSWWWV